MYDKWNESRGNEAIRVGRREMRLVRACERRGRGVLRRMEGERRERLGGEMERRERYLYEARADRERLGLSKKNKVEPVMSTVTATPIPLPDERASLGRTSRAPSLARTSLSYREPGTGAGIERRPTLREMRRNDMTQMQSDTPSDDVKRKMSSASRMPGGAEARIGQVFRRGSKRSIRKYT